SELADQARASDDVLFALKTQAQAAMLLMPYDREEGRGILRLVFDRLFDLLSDANSEQAGRNQSRGGSRADLEQLRSDLLTGIAGSDPELAEELGRAIAFAKSSGAGTTGSDSHQQDGSATSERHATASEPAGRDTVRREMLIGIALQIVEREPQRA